MDWKDFEAKDYLLIGLVVIVIFAVALLFSPVSYEQPVKEDSGSGGEESFSRGDLMFMNMMIVHHDQAIRMAELADNRTSNEKILDLAENISKAQTRENNKMKEWMKSMGYEPGNHHKMAGMASEREMQQLRNSENGGFNELFAELMIEHHQGGIEMAENFYGSGEHDELNKMQGRMITAQEKEISLMNEWLETNQI